MKEFQICLKAGKILRNRIERRISRIQYAWISRGSESVQTTTKDGFEMLLPPSDGEIAPKIYRDGRYDDSTCKTLRQHLNPGDVAIDVGANIGQMSLVMADAVGDTGSVISFEPDSYNQEFLEKNLDANGVTNTQIREVALGRQNGTTDLIRHKSNKGAHSTVADAIRSSDELDTIKIEIQTLDSVDVSPDLIKIDTEGGEPAVIEGGMETILENRPIIHLEVDPDKWDRPVAQVMGELFEMGYRFWDVNANEELTLSEISAGIRLNVIARTDAR